MKSKKSKYETDVAILSVTTTEFNAVMHFHDWKAKTFDGDDQIYDVATFERDGKTHTLYFLWKNSGKMDDSVFRNFLIDRHGRETVENLRPCLVEHVDWIVGGSVLHPWRGHLARATFWDDEQLVRELKEAVRGKVQYAH